MLGSNTGRIQSAIAVAFGTAFAAGVLACASSSSPPSETDRVGAQVEDVLVESFDHGSTVMVVGPEEPAFTAFQQTDPDRVVVDLSNVGAGEHEGTVAVYDGIVDEVRVEAIGTEGGDPVTRIELALTGPSDFDVRAESGGLVIDVSPLAGTMDSSEEDAEPADEMDDPWGATLAGDSSPSNMEDAEDPWSGEGSPAEPALSATVLSSIDARAVGQASMIELKADGRVDSATTFTLESPERLVIDLPGLKSEVASPRIEVGSEQVARVRVGEHADKVRVVIDAGSKANSFENRQVIPVPTGLVIALGADPELEDAIADASGAMPETAAAPEPAGSDVGFEPMPSPMASDTDEVADAGAPLGEDEGARSETPGESGSKAASGEHLVTIYGVEFDQQAELDRVVILGEEPVDYLVYEPDPETIVLSISGAVIAPEAAVRVAPETPGPVSLVTAFEQPDMKRPEVRIVVKRAANLKPEVSRRGSLLMMDFPRTGALAATPPVFDAQPAESVEPAAASAPIVATTAPSGEATIPIAVPPAPVDDGTPSLPTTVAAPAEPASAEPPAAIDILSEGGLLDGKEYVGRRISLDFKEVDIADVLRLIAEVSDLNVIAGDEVKGAVTIRLVDVPWDQALDVILLTKGLGFARIGNVLRIASADVIAQEEEVRLQERRAKEKLEDLVVKLQPVNYADVKDVSKMVKELLTPRGSVNTDTRTNTLIIKDIASVIDEATALVKAVDTMTPQVMIEAKIVEASLDFSRELGSVWTFGTNPDTESSLGGRDYIFQQGADDDIADGWGNQVVFGNPITAGPTSLVALAATVLDQRFNYEIEVQAAEANGDGKVISSPRIVTLDNSTATIEQGVSIPFQTFENGDAALEFVDAVLKLDVTPHITSDHSIIMEIKVSRNAPDDSVFTLTGSPAIAKNQVETETLVKDGQTLVLGGIYVVDRSQRQSRVPYLNRVPLLGRLFKSDEFTDSRKELLVFVSPRVVLTPGAEAS